MARRTADKIQAEGWVIAAVSNWSGQKVTQTTVYYPEGYADQADKLAALVDGDERGARRAVEEGLAHVAGAVHAVTRACLTDLAAQLDGEAALARLARRTPGPAG